MSAKEAELRVRSFIKSLWVGNTDPILFKVFNAHQVVASEETDNMRIGNGKLEFNTEWVMQISDELLKTHVLKEGMRCVMKHPYLRKQPDGMANYLASNITLQEYLITQLEMPKAKEAFPELLASNMTKEMRQFQKVYEEDIQTGSLSPQEIEEMFGKSKAELDSMYNSLPTYTEEDLERRSKEFYYDLIKQNSPEANAKALVAIADSFNEDEDEDEEKSEGQSQGQGDEEDSEENSESDSSGQGQGQSDQEKIESMAKNASSWADNPYMNQQVDQFVKEAMMGGDGSWGSIKGKMRETLIANLKPKADYKKMMRIFKASVIASTTKLTRMRFSRRVEGQMGRRSEFTTNVDIYVDVSGSMSSRSLQNAFGFANKFFAHGVKAVRCYQWDADLAKECIDLKKPQFNVELCGRGGTNVTCVFKKALQEIKERKFGGAIIFTDGHFSKPSLTEQELKTIKKHKRKFLWVFEDEKTLDTHKKSFHKEYGALSFIVPQ